MKSYFSRITSLSQNNKVLFVHEQHGLELMGFSIPPPKKKIYIYLTRRRCIKILLKKLHQTYFKSFLSKLYFLNVNCPYWQIRFSLSQIEKSRVWKLISIYFYILFSPTENHQNYIVKWKNYNNKKSNKTWAKDIFFFLWIRNRFSSLFSLLNPRYLRW